MIRAALSLVAALVAWFLFFVSGAFPWLGVASQTRRSIAFGPLTNLGSSGTGYDFGLETFLFFEGQEIVIEYDAQVRAGALWFYVYRPLDGVTGEGSSFYITESSKGTWTTKVDRTALYHVTIDATPSKGRGKGYDVSYHVKWGARPARES